MCCCSPTTSPLILNRKKQDAAHPTTEPPPRIDACSGALSPNVDIMAAVEAERGGADGGRPDALDEAELGGSGGGAPSGGGATAVPEVGIIGRRLPGKVDCVKDRSLAVVHLRMMDWCDGSFVSVAVDGRSSRIGDDGRERGLFSMRTASFTRTINCVSSICGSQSAFKATLHTATPPGKILPDKGYTSKIPFSTKSCAASHWYS
mmetsp:Transcript_2186/g.6089  ORF Transcript_2186/g.6089 Transcript_2186/m.6089 type:complete len:205 (-) Transcript_2186:4656-5270(-)